VLLLIINIIMVCIYLLLFVVFSFPLIHTHILYP